MGQIVPYEQFPFIGPSNPEESGLFDYSRTINLYYEPAYLATNRPALIGTPGLSSPLVTLAQTPVRALQAFMNGRLFAVGGLHAYEINPSTGAILHDITLAGALSGDYQCRFACNGVQFMVCDPSPTATTIYSLDLAGNTATSRLTGFALEYLDGFFVALASGASLAGTNPNQINASAFNDGTTWPALAFVLKEGSSDQVNQLAVVNNLLWIFGAQNIEVWYNAGLPNFPFARVNGGTINVGCWVPQTVAKIQNSVMWLGSSERGWGRVYLANGFVPVPVSTPSIEQVINRALNGAGNTVINKTSAFAYEEAGHVFYVLNIPGSQFTSIFNASGSGLTLVYDLATKLWHERQYFNAGNPIMGLPWVFASVIQSPFNGLTQNFVGNFNGCPNGSGTQGAVYKYGLQYASDNGVSIERARSAAHHTDDNRWTKYPSFELHADIGTAAARIGYSNDGGVTWPVLNRPDVAITGQKPSVMLGTYNQYRWRQLGRARKRTMQVLITDSTNAPIVLIRGILKATPGTEK